MTPTPDKDVFLLLAATDPAAQRILALLEAKVRATFGHVVGKPHADTLPLVSKVIADAPLVTPHDLVPQCMSLICNLRGELSEPSYAAVSRVLGAIVKAAFLADVASGKVPPGECGCPACSAARAAGANPTKH
jgi:hypothetical protein